MATHKALFQEIAKYQNRPGDTAQEADTGPKDSHDDDRCKVHGGKVHFSKNGDDWSIRQKDYNHIVGNTDIHGNRTDAGREFEWHARESKPFISKKAHAMAKDIKKQQIDALADMMMGRVLNDREKEVDIELERLENLTDEDYAKLRQARMAAVKARQAERAEWRINGHGVYTTLLDQKDFFAQVKKSRRVICHFYRKENKYCADLRPHLQKLAERHMETRFLEIDAERSPYLCENLGITVLPSLVLAIGNKIDRQVIGLHPFLFRQRHDNNDIVIETHVMEIRLLEWNVIEEPLKCQIRSAVLEEDESEDSDLDL